MTKILETKFRSFQFFLSIIVSYSASGNYDSEVRLAQRLLLGLVQRISEMKTYYAIVNLADRLLGAYVSAEDLASAFKAATHKYKTRHPRLHVETIAVQEMVDEYVTGIWRAPGPSSATH
jgi:hypothetical protein